MKRALATILTVAGISFATYGPANAVAGALPGIAAPLADTAGDTVTTVGWDGNSGCCWWDWPILGAGVAFWELSRDREVDYHCCNRRWHGYSRARYAAPRYARARYAAPRYAAPRRYYRSPCW
jgi:hypothetical protein